MKQQLKNEIEKYNQKIIEEGKKGKSFKVIKGKVPIILSAPHCVKHMRKENELTEEGETGAIVQYLAEHTNCWCIYKTSNNQDDANYDIENNPYKEEIAKIVKNNSIKYLLDIHGADNDNIFDIEIGTDNGKNIQGKKELIKNLEKILKKAGIETIFIDQKFKASSIHTVSKSISLQTEIPCIQLEIAGRYRYKKNIDGIEKLINALTEWIELVK